MLVSDSMRHTMLGSAIFAVLASCSSPPPPRSRDAIFQERMELPQLFLTYPSRHKIMAPGSKGVFVDPQSNELCWPAMTCDNPQCPGRHGEETAIFINPDLGTYIRPDGRIGYDPELERKAKDKVHGCPECAKIRNPKRETKDEKQQYMRWVHPYVLPETANRLKELDEEDRKREELYKERHDRKFQKLPDRG